MITAFLLSIALDSSLHDTPPQFHHRYEDLANCIADAAKRNRGGVADKGALEDGRLFFCVRVVFPD